MNNFTDFLIFMNIMYIVLTIVIYVNAKGAFNLKKEETPEGDDENINEMILDELNKPIRIENKKNIDITKIQQPNLKFEDIIVDIDNMINLVFITELYTSDLQGGLHVTKDDNLKKIAKTLTQKILDSISDNFRSKIYLFMDENLLVEVIYSNIVKRLLSNVDVN